MRNGARRVLVPSLLGGLVSALFAIQFHVFPQLKIEAAERGLPPSVTSLLRVLRDPVEPDLVLPVLAAVVFALALVVAEVAGRRVSGALLDWSSTRRGALLLALATAAVLTRFLIEPGLPHQFDARLHLMQSAETAGMLGAGEWPDYTFTWYGGFPLLRFSGVLLHFLVGVAGLLTGSVAGAAKLVVWLSGIGSAWAVFTLVRELGGGPRGALLGAVGVAISFQHTHEVALAGRLPVALLYLLFPILLLLAERLVKRPGSGVAVRFGVVAALLVLAHPGLAPYGVIAAVAFIGLRLLARRVSPRIWGRTFLLLSVAGGLCIVLTAFLVVPALVEGDSVQLGTMYATGGLDVSPVPDLGQVARILLWSNVRGRESVAYIGLSLLGLFLFAMFRRNLPGEIRFALGGIALVLLFFTGGTYLAARSVHFLVVVVATGAGLGATGLGGGRFALLLLLVLVDLGPTTVQSPFRPDLSYDVEFLHRAAAMSDGERALRVSVRDGTWAASEWSSNYDSGQPMATGPFREAAGSSYPLLLDLLDRVSNDLNRGEGLAPETRLGFRILGVRLLLFEDGRRAVLPDSIPDGLLAIPEIPALRVMDASPVVALLGSAGSGSAGPDPLDLEEAGGLLPARSGAARLLDREYRRERVRLEVETEQGGRILLAFAHLPGVAVTVGGVPVAAERGPFGLVAVPVSRGRHDIEVGYRAPTYAVVSRLISAFGLLLLLAVLVAAGLRGRVRA